jgi:hypothetical protein
MAPEQPEAPEPETPGDDAVEHLWNAAHEMLRAFRTLIDAADEFVESQRGGRPAERREPEPRAGRMHHIDIDDDPDDDSDDDPDSGTGVA